MNEQWDRAFAAMIEQQLAKRNDRRELERMTDEGDAPLEDAA